MAHRPTHINLTYVYIDRSTDYVFHLFSCAINAKNDYDNYDADYVKYEYIQ